MAEVHLRRISTDNEKECLDIRVDDARAKFVATNAKSLAEAKSNSRLVPLAVYARAACGYPKPRVPMVGFVMCEIDCGVGLILRIMIDRAHQRRSPRRSTARDALKGHER